jgi:multicomponent Na+:H+ antiporter subunit E
MRRTKLIFIRTILLTGLWLVVSGGSTSDPWIIMVVVVTGVATATWLWPSDEMRFDVAAAIRFAPYFVRQSILGGWDVARRALMPSLPIEPALIEFELSSPSVHVRTLLAWTVSLLPGTASVYLAGDRLCVHVLDRNAPNVARLGALESRIMAILHQE